MGHTQARKLCTLRRPMAPRPPTRAKRPEASHLSRNRKEKKWKRCCMSCAATWVSVLGFFFGVLYAQLRVCVNQSFILPGFWKVKMSRRTFCSTQTSCCHYQYTTSHPHTAIEYHSQRFLKHSTHTFNHSDTRNSRRCLVNYRFIYLFTRANQRGVCSVESIRTVWYIVHKYTNTTDVKVLVIIIVD